MDLLKTKLISTQDYCLSQLFSTANRKIIIPDFQRDYCWGDMTHGSNGNTDVVSGFLDTLIEEFQTGSLADILLGKIDVYEYPENSIHLTDGQQRLTTLYLLIGMLYRHTGDQRLRRCLISEQEEATGCGEPYLKYAVRESTVFFLRDLVKEYFLSRNPQPTVSLIKQPWYFDEYKVDNSVKSMLLCLQTIEKKLTASTGLYSDDFAEFLIHHVKIQYYDVQDKRHGEERFVIINSTGKSLTNIENTKPLFLAAIADSTRRSELSDQWEHRETWFWRNRSSNENIADDGVNDFLYWCFQIIDKQNDLEIIKKSKDATKLNKAEYYLERINTLFIGLQQLESLLGEEEFQSQFKFVNESKVKGISGLRKMARDKRQNLLLPLLAVIEKFPSEKTLQIQMVRRLRKNHFHQQWEERSDKYIDWRYLLQLIDNSSSLEDCLSYDGTFTQLPNVKLPIVPFYDQEERTKAKFTAHKEMLSEWEDHQDFMGDLSYLLNAGTQKDQDENFHKNLGIFEGSFEQLNKLFVNYGLTVDLTRDEQSAMVNPPLANVFRLFRLFIGCNSVGHIYRASWDFEGVQFSSTNRVHFRKKSFLALIQQDTANLAQFCESLIKERIEEENLFGLENYNCDTLIKAWLSLKVFASNENDLLVPFYDGQGEGTGLACYRDMERNKIVPNQPFSLENAICGFAVRSGFGNGNYVSYTNFDNWNKIEILDCPFEGIPIDLSERTAAHLNLNAHEINRILTKNLSPETIE